MAATQRARLDHASTVSCRHTHTGGAYMHASEGRMRLRSPTCADLTAVACQRVRAEWGKLKRPIMIATPATLLRRTPPATAAPPGRLGAELRRQQDGDCLWEDGDLHHRADRGRCHQHPGHSCPTRVHGEGLQQGCWRWNARAEYASTTRPCDRTRARCTLVRRARARHTAPDKGQRLLECSSLSKASAPAAGTSSSALTSPCTCQTRVSRRF